MKGVLRGLLIGPWKDHENLLNDPSRFSLMSHGADIKHMFVQFQMRVFFPLLFIIVVETAKRDEDRISEPHE